MERWEVPVSFVVVMLILQLHAIEPIFPAVARIFRWLCSSPLKASSGVVVVALSAYALPSCFHVPSPILHDEFANLLAADTFAHWRLTNPPHALAEFFETFHVLQNPTYMSKFPVGTALVLAAGSWINLPLAGIWMSQALAVVAVLWTLRAALPVRWAVGAGLLLAVHPTVMFFTQSYWGGSVAMLGGALVSGVTLRLIGRAPPLTPGRLGLIAGAGMGILANSRPYEGMLLTILCALAVLFISARRHRLRPILLRAIPASLAVLTVFGGWMMYDNWRVTGNAMLLPYSLHASQYMSTPLFYWQSIPDKHAYPNAVMEHFYVDEEGREYQAQLGWRNFLGSVAGRLSLVMDMYIRPLTLLIPVAAAAAWGWRRRSDDRGMILFTSLFICIILPIVHVLTCPWMRIAYMAPLAPLLMVVVGNGLYILHRLQWRGREIGKQLIVAVVVCQIVVSVTSTLRFVRDNAHTMLNRKPQLVDYLTQKGGEHVVFVKYGPKSESIAEWVYNGADIDGSKVVFARWLAPSENAAMMRYFNGRTFWRLDVEDLNMALLEMRVTKATRPAAE